MLVVFSYFDNDCGRYSSKDLWDKRRLFLFNERSSDSYNPEQNCKYCRFSLLVIPSKSSTFLVSFTTHRVYFCLQGFQLKCTHETTEVQLFNNTEPPWLSMSDEQRRRKSCSFSFFSRNCLAIPGLIVICGYITIHDNVSRVRSFDSEKKQGFLWLSWWREISEKTVIKYGCSA